mgnify:CR=1 FL=1
MKKISSIKKKQNKYIVYFDKEYISLYTDTIIKFNLLKPRNISDAEYKDIILYNDFVDAYNKALKLIGIKLRTKKEIKDKLSDYNKDTIDKVILLLQKNGYLCEELYISAYINDKLNLSNDGPKKIQNNLEKLCLDKDKIYKQIKLISDDVWLDRINKAIKKKEKQNKKLSKSMFVKKVKSDLLLLGYPGDLINKKIDLLDSRNDFEILKSVYNKEYRKLSRKYEGENLKNKLKYSLYNKGFKIDDINKVIE